MADKRLLYGPYEGPDEKIRLQIARDVVKVIREHCKAAFPFETGGILVGKYVDGSYALVTLATAAPPDSIATRTTFLRGVEGLSHVLEERWELGEHYLGEWHFHPNAKPDASPTDCAQMQSISSAALAKCEKPLMLIFGGNPKKALSLNAYIFGAGPGLAKLVPHRWPAES